MPNTTENLKEAFAGESQAFQKYSAFAKAAEKDGMPNIARLFRTTAQAELIHAEGHLKALEGIGGTVDNLQGAIEGETYEFTEMYPQMIEDAIEEGNKGAQMSFEVANAVEKIHADLYQKALDAMAGLAETDYYVCDVCGNTVKGEAPDKCPICGVDETHFMKID